MAQATALFKQQNNSFLPHQNTREPPNLPPHLTPSTQEKGKSSVLFTRLLARRFTPAKIRGDDISLVLRDKLLGEQEKAKVSC